MIPTLFFHAAILAQLAASHATSHFNLYAAKQELQYGSCETDLDSPPPPIEKVVIRENTLSEKYGLEFKPAAQPSDREREFAAVREEARRVAPKIDWLRLRKEVALHLPAPPIVNTDWNGKFAFRRDDDGAFWLGGTYYPVAPDPPRFGGW